MTYLSDDPVPIMVFSQYQKQTQVEKQLAWPNHSMDSVLFPFSIPQILVPRCDTASRLRLNRSDFENHILRPKCSIEEVTTSLGGGEATVEGESDVDSKGTVFISANNKVK